jgi:hypothetical protein
MNHIATLSALITGIAIVGLLFYLLAKEYQKINKQ